MDSEIVFITGATRGLGLGTEKELLKQGFKVIMTGRNKLDLKDSREALRSDGLEPHILQLDVSNEEDIENARNHVQQKFGKIDCFINNAGIIIENDFSFSDLPKQKIFKTIETNALGPLGLMQSFADLLATSKNPRIVNVNSGMGSVTELVSRIFGPQKRSLTPPSKEGFFRDGLKFPW